MNALSTRPLPRRATWGGGRLLAAVPVVLLLALVACGTGTVVTSTGAVVPAATVEAQDNIADVLHLIRETHRAYVANVWEPGKTALDPATRASRYQLLVNLADGLDASQAALVAWKRASVGATPLSVLRPILAQAPAFLDLAVQAHILTQAQADVAKGILGSIPMADILLQGTPTGGVA